MLTESRTYHENGRWGNQTDEMSPENIVRGTGRRFFRMGAKWVYSIRFSPPNQLGLNLDEAITYYEKLELINI